MIDLSSFKRIVENSLHTFLVRNGIGELVGIEVLQVVERPFSTIVFYRAHTNKQPYDAVLKKVVHHPDNLALTKKENQAELEHAMLSFLFPYFKEEIHCSVPEPIAVFPEQEAYLMEYFSGKLLNEQFKAARYFSPAKDFTDLKYWYYFCGRWLKRFQEVTATELASGDIFLSTMARCEEKLNMINKAHDPRCPTGLKDVVMAGLQSELRKLGEDSINVAGRHGDFGGWNILVNSERVMVFDFLGSQTDSIAVDVLKMLVNFEDEKHYLFYSKSKVEELKKCFLAGYGPMPIIQRPVAVICETLHRVCSLCASVVHVGESKVHRKVERHLIFKEHLDWLLYADKKKLLWSNVMKV